MACLVAFGLLAYAPTVQVQFIGDDFVFLDRVRDMNFFQLWSRSHTDFGWYRPWSREFHFWFMSHLFGPAEAAFRVASLVLWMTMLVLYRQVMTHDAGRALADLATLGVASLSLWGASLTWISGVQDLWMLVFALISLRFDQSSAWRWAALPYALALLSKETAVVLPMIVFARARLVSGSTWRDACIRVLPFVGTTLVWFAVHPVLWHRLTHPEVQLATGEPPLPPLDVLTSSLRAMLNLDHVGKAIDSHAWRPTATVASAVTLAIATWWALRAPVRDRRRETPEPTPARLASFGAIWCAVAWLPLFSRSVGWHAYYACLGALGIWLALAVALRRIPHVAVALLLGLGLLRGAAAATPSWDWGSEWYQTRAGNLLGVIREQLRAMHPVLPHHTRVYFGNLPNNIGLIAGRSPAIRVWYDDPTLQAGFYSYYRPRSQAEPAGVDLFFHFDSTTGIREVRPESPPPPGLGPNSDWESDHRGLAMAFLTGGDRPRAAREFESIANLPHRTDALMFAGAIWRAVGDSARARDLFAEAQRRTGKSREEIADWARMLAATMPDAPPRAP